MRAIQRVRPGGKLYLVHGWEVAEAWRGRGTYQPYVNRALTDAEVVLEGAHQAHPGLREIRWEAELIAGPPARSIADVATVRHADEIMVGTRGFGRVRALLGSVAHELIHLAPCPVTVIPERMVDVQGGESATDTADAAA
jgi:nucleotide-binding universal stress UspA family protein